MEGQRLILKRRIPRGRQRLVAVFVGAFVVAGLVMIAQLKTTLSSHSLAAVRSDFTAMRDQAAENTAAATGKTSATSPVPTPPASSSDAAVEKFKKLLQDTPEKSP